MPTPRKPRAFTVEAADGVRLAAFAAGDPERATVLLVHGYPDTHAVWDVVARELAKRHHVLIYDVRGSGASERPSARNAYALEVLAADARAVARARCPDARVHLVGHDWGSVTAWEAATGPDAAEWIASFTTVSGPCLDHVSDWIRDTLRHPAPAKLGPLVRQQAKSWYLAAFQVPGVAEAAWRHGLAGHWDRRLQRTEGLEPGEGTATPTLAEDAVAGLNIYRANVLRRMRAKPAPRPAAVPVQFVVPLRDRYVSPAMARTGVRWASPAWWRTIDTGHWGALVTHGTELAGYVDELARHIDGEDQAPGLLAARVD